MGQFKLAAGEEGGSVLGGWEQSARVFLGCGHYCCVVFLGVGSWTAQGITHLSDNLKCVGRCLDALLEAARFTTRCQDGWSGVVWRCPTVVRCVTLGDPSLEELSWSVIGFVML